MPRHTAEDEWDEDFGESNEDDEEPTVPCPYCKREIHEDAERCPHCEQYISDEDAPTTAKPWWIIVGVLLCFYAIYHWIVRRAHFSRGNRPGVQGEPASSIAFSSSFKSTSISARSFFTCSASSSLAMR
jgi:hypothetical protein